VKVNNVIKHWRHADINDAWPFAAMPFSCHQKN
jgi:hypothetical protein